MQAGRPARTPTRLAGTPRRPSRGSATYLCEVNQAEDRVEDPWNKCSVNDLALVEGPILLFAYARCTIGLFLLSGQEILYGRSIFEEAYKDNAEGRVNNRVGQVAECSDHVH